MRYVVTGSDGQLGGRVAVNMLSQVSGEQLIFTFPFPERLPKEKKEIWETQGVELRVANYDNKAQMIESFEGAERMFMVSGVFIGPKRVQQHQNAIDAAKEAGVKHITYTSFFGANREGYDQYVLPDHRATEKYLSESGIGYNIMRNTLYLENYLINSVMLANISDYKWVTNAGETAGAFIPKDDSGRVATALLLGKGEPKKDYDVTGNLITQREICEMVADASGIDYEYVPVNDQEFLKYLDSIHIPRESSGDFSKSPVPWCANDMLTNEGGIRKGQMAIQTDTVERLTGRKPMNASELIDRYSFVWKEKVTSYWDLVKYI